MGPQAIGVALDIDDDGVVDEKVEESGCDDVMDLSLCGVAFLWKTAPLLRLMKRSEEEKTHDGNHDDRN